MQIDEAWPRLDHFMWCCFFKCEMLEIGGGLHDELSWWGKCPSGRRQAHPTIHNKFESIWICRPRQRRENGKFDGVGLHFRQRPRMNKWLVNGFNLDTLLGICLQQRSATQRSRKWSAEIWMPFQNLAVGFQSLIFDHIDDTISRRLCRGNGDVVRPVNPVDPCGSAEPCQKTMRRVTTPWRAGINIYCLVGSSTYDWNAARGERSLIMSRIYAPAC